MVDPVTDNVDARDLAAAAAGHQPAFARLFDRHGPVVLSLCRRRAPADAEDATQETFIRAYRMLDRLDDPGRFRPWLYAIARRVCAEHHRARRRRREREETAMTLTARERPNATDAVEDHERREALERLGDAIEALDDRERLAIHLHYLDADPVRAAGDALGLSRSGYYKLLDRARRNLRTAMTEARTT